MRMLIKNGKINSCGERIKELRQTLGISQNDLAVKLQLVGLGITQKTISRIETGDRVVPDYELKYFAEALGVSVSFLLGLEP
ncbi:MAG: helix-turn-helix transcriptional regulator [Clostridiales bacterium]|nr:helix-turn-helix transcriptional regulator [Clostridiales bacterium]